METSSRIFISYSRTDGRDFAEAFERQLKDDAGIRSWRDLTSMGSGDIRPQVLRAIEQAQHLVLILSRRALASDWVKREWTHAREWGRMVSPVLADPTLHRADLPGWMRRSQIYEIADPEQWQLLRRVLEGSGETRRVPYMAGDLAEDFVARPAEYARLKEAVLSAGSETAVALTTALRGAGGYGKTTLANYLCRDPDVRFEFADGILRVEIGKERDDVTGLIIDLIETLEPQGKRPGFQDVQTAAEYLAKLIGEARLLLVIDDVWREAQLRPFLRGGPNCARLVTTRLPQVLPARHTPIVIDAMQDAEALRLIAVNLPDADKVATRVRLTALADRLGNWAQMLGIANGWMRERVGQGEPLGDAIDRFERRLSARGLIGFDPRDERQRNRAIHACVEASLEDLPPDELAKLGELAVLPEDAAVPLSVVEALWRETGGLDADETDNLMRRLHGLSLLQSLDLADRTLRLHDNMIWYLRDQIGAEGCRAAHAAMVRAMRTQCDGRWETLSPGHVYGWQFLIRHLRGAGQDVEADRLLTDYAWLKVKLRAAGGSELLGSYLPESNNDGVRLIGRAIALSLPALGANTRELPRQIFGRLASSRIPGFHYYRRSKLATISVSTSNIVTAARADPDFRPAPRWPGLTPPGAERLRLIGHQAPVTSACFSPDGTQILTASRDGTARLWDGTTGQEIATLRGHEGPVLSARFSPDGARIVTASYDSTACLWDVKTWQQIGVLQGHGAPVENACFSPDGVSILTASMDGTAKLWNVANPEGVRTFRRNRMGIVTSANACFSPDGARILTITGDGTVAFWDVTSGHKLAAPPHYEAWTANAAFSPDGFRIITVSFDGTMRLWNVTTGKELIELRGHFDPNYGQVESPSFSPDGGRVVTGSRRGTVRLWDSATGHELVSLYGHEDSVQSASFSPDGTRIVTASADGTARIWHVEATQEIEAPRSRTGPVTNIICSPDGMRIVTTFERGAARLWDARTGQELAVLGGRESEALAAHFSHDGTGIVTVSPDGLAHVWEATTGQKLFALRGQQGSVRNACFSQDGGHVITTSSSDRATQLWNATTGRQRTMAMQSYSDQPMLSAFVSQGVVQIITASWSDNVARLWDATIGEQLNGLRGHEMRIHSASFSPDGARIVTASEDRTARLWDAATGQELATLCGHEGGVNSACFSPNGTRIVTASDDRTARIWDVATGQEVARIALDAAITGLSVHGGAIALGDALGRIHVFDADEFLRAEGRAGG